jgi:hypothetical protein
MAEWSALRIRQLAENAAVLSRRDPPNAEKPVETQVFTDVLYIFERKKKNLIFFLAETTGGMAEWSNAAVLKTVEAQVSGGSNPSPSALKSPGNHVGAFLLNIDTFSSLVPYP